MMCRFSRTTGEVVCTVWWSSRSSCAGVNLDVDNTAGYGPETVTWSDAENDPYDYLIYINDYGNGGVKPSGARIALYGETTVNLEAATASGNSTERWVGFKDEDSNFFQVKLNI